MNRENAARGERVRRGVRQMLALGMCLVLFACGGSKKGTDMSESSDPELNIDQLLGIEDPNAGMEETTPNAGESGDKNADKNAGEDEVLKLLGITSDDQKPEESKSAEPMTPATEEEPMTPSRQLADLQTQLMEKDNLIASLRAQLEEKERALSQITPANGNAGDVAAKPAAVNLGSGSDKSRYDAALQYYYARNYRQAIQAFTALAESGIETSLADNCQYWLGESYYALKNYSQASVEFEKVFRYPNSNKADAALLKLGLCYLRLGENEKARSQFELLLVNHPRSEYVDRARTHLGNL